MNSEQKMDKIFMANRAWAERVRTEDPAFFDRLAHLQAPEYLWIGCSDSRVPANEITGLLPGEVFVHRNIANVVVHTDLNCLSVIQFAIDVLKVRHIMVVGHFGCGGVRAALENARVGLADNWLRHIQDVRDKHHALLESIADEHQRWACLCELNVLEQAVNVARTTLVRDSWARDQALTVHGWIYGLTDGLLRDTGFIVSTTDEVDVLAAHSLDALCRRYVPS
ncbi:MAG: carbonate dehydratase [Rugosibacter sp.]|jgi:carbonic anhydrase|nr:carbonate dehydratase [Rugosibacter sp.]MDO9272356.1 carbonate dehydratase [Rugosibacter sp.]